MWRQCTLFANDALELCTDTTSGVARWWRVRTAFLARRNRRPTARTLLTVRNASDAIALVRSQEREQINAEDLCDRIHRLFRAFPPSEIDMRYLSILQQQHTESGGIANFCTLTLFVVASEVLLIGGLPPVTRAKRAVTWPTWKRRRGTHRRHKSWAGERTRA
jgi:hypothetical protein